MIGDDTRRVSWLETETDSVNTDVQNSMIPYLETLPIKRKYRYNFNGKMCQIERREIVFCTEALKFYIKTSEATKIIDSPMIELVEKKKLQAFMLFLDGRFIPWSMITIKNDCRNEYICINSDAHMDTGIEYDVHLIQIPFNVKYTENNKGFEGCTELFRFNKNGYLSVSGNIVIYKNAFSDIYYTNKYAMEDLYLYDLEIPAKYKIREENILVFKDGLLSYDYNIQTLPMNIVNMAFGDINNEVVYKIFYDKRVEYKHDNILHLGSNDNEIKEDVKNYIKASVEIPQIYSKSFDFAQDPTLTDEDNMVNSTRYIAEYNSQLLETDPDTIADTITKTGKEIKAMIDDKNYLQMLRYIARPDDNSVLVFKNGVLYDRYYTIKYDLNTFRIKTIPDDIEDDDVFEFIFYKNIENKVLVDIPIDSEGIIPYIEATLPANNITILSDEPSENMYTVLDTGYAFYSVPFTSYGNMLKVTDSFYYGKKVTIITKNHFEYARYVTESKNNRIILGGIFKYYYEESNYMVFVNGRKMNTGFKVITPMENSPVNQPVIYLECEYDAGDSVEVFYLPEGIKEDMLKPTYNLIRRVYTNPTIMTYKIPIPYKDFFKDGNYVDITNEYGQPMNNMVVDYEDNTVTFLNNSRIELAFDYKIKEFIERMKLSMKHAPGVFKRFDDSELDEDILYYTDDMEVIEKSHEIVDELFGMERPGIVRLFHKMVDNAYNGPCAMEWSIRDNLEEMFEYVRVSSKIADFIKRIDQIMGSTRCAYRCFDDSEVGFDDIYHTDDESVITTAHGIVDEIFGYEPDSILKLFHRMVDDSFNGPCQIEWSLRKNLDEMFIDPEDNIDNKDYAAEFDKKLRLFIGKIGSTMDSELSHFKCFDDSEIGEDYFYYTNDPMVISNTHDLVDQMFSEESQRIRDILHRIVDDSYMEPNRIEWSLRTNLPDMFIYIRVANRIDAFIEDIYSIARSRFNVDLDDTTLYYASPTIESMLREKVQEWFGDEPDFIIRLFNRLVDEAFRKPSGLKLSLRFKLGQMFTMIPYVIVFNFKYRGGDLGLSDTGYIRIKRREAPIGINKNTVLIFVNGKKVRQDYIENISSSLVKITHDIESIENLNVIRIANPENWVIDIGEIESIHDNFMIHSTVDKRNLLHDTFNRISNLEDPMLYDIEQEMISNEIITDFYTGKSQISDMPFIYVYDTDNFVSSNDGVYISTVLDNRRRSNIINDIDSE